jgi:hypothetical protein
VGLHSLAPARLALRAACGIASRRSQRLGFGLELARGIWTATMGTRSYEPLLDPRLCGSENPRAGRPRHYSANTATERRLRRTSAVATTSQRRGEEARENTHFAKRTQFSARRWGNRKVHCQKPTQIGLPAEDEILCHGGTMVVAVHLTNTAPESPLTEGAGLLDFTREVSPVSWR